MMMFVFFITLFVSFILEVVCFLFLIINKSKIIDALCDLGFMDYAKFLQRIYIPVRGTSISDQRESNKIWHTIKKIETNDAFLKKVKCVLKAMDCIRIFAIAFASIGTFIGIIYLWWCYRTYAD